MTDDGQRAEPAVALPWRRRTRRSDPSFASPVVRRLAEVHHLDLATMRGTGRGGRVTRSDARAAIAARASGQAPDELVALTPVRRAIGEHLLRARTQAAHAHVIVACDYTRVEHARRDAHLTYLPFIARAVVDALRDFPHCNATVDGDELVVHPSVGLGIAVDLEFEGLIVPVLHRAEDLRVRALAREIGQLADRARARELAPDDVAGGTFTITNPGPFGTFASVPIVNVPQVAILATDAVRKQVIAVEREPAALAIRPLGMLSLSFDHRVMDGAYAASFVGRVRDILQDRDWAVEL